MTFEALKVVRKEKEEDVAVASVVDERKPVAPAEATSAATELDAATLLEVEGKRDPKSTRLSRAAVLLLPPAMALSWYGQNYDWDWVSARSDLNGLMREQAFSLLDGDYVGGGALWLLGVLVCVLVGLWLWNFWLACMETPELHYKHSNRNVAIMQMLGSHLRTFSPVPWFALNHVQTVMFAYWPPKVVLGLGSSKVKYEREVVPMDDGGLIAMDWLRCESDDPTTPIVLVFPGVIGASTDTYIKRTMLTLRKHGWHSVCKSWRGINAPMDKALPETWSARTLADTDTIVRHLRKHHPHAPILGLGFSFGGHLLQSYLGYLSDHGTEENNIIGGVSVSGAFDSNLVYSHGLASNTFPPYDVALATSVRMDMSPHLSLLEKELRALGQPTERLRRCTNMYQWHDTVTRVLCPDCPAPTVQEYFDKVDAIHMPNNSKICRPCLCILANDDPICPSRVVQRARAGLLKSENVILVNTKRGGHCGWFEGMWGENWADDLTYEYLKAVLDTQ